MPATVIDVPGFVARGRAAAWRASLRSDDGSSAIELAVLGPVILLIIFSIIQFALVEYGANVALHSAREAVSTLRLIDEPTCQTRQQQVAADTVTYARSLGSAALESPTVKPLCGADSVSVTVTGHATSLVPGLTISVSRTASGRVEHFTPDTP